MDAEMDLLLYQIENGSTVDAGRSAQKSSTICGHQTTSTKPLTDLEL